MQGVASPPAAVFDSWNAIWQGALSVHNRRLVLEVRRRLDQGDPCFEWRVRPRPSWGIMESCLPRPPRSDG